MTIVGETASVTPQNLSVSFGYDLSDISADDIDALVKDLKSSGGDPRVLLERLVVELCRAA